MVVSPKVQMTEYSQAVGPTKSEAKLTKDGLCICCGAHAMHHFTKKEKSNSSHLLQRDKSNQNAIFKLFKHHQLIPALHSTGNHEFWYCSRSRLMHNSSKTTGSNQDMLGNEEAWWKTNGHVHSSPKRTQGVAPTAQTREKATLLMLI
uniref:Uncharacterized protein n=1 Tax=Fagus sylvatica TaxID=28930 RepID=A0A2N9FV47_FAGSY